MFLHVHIHSSCCFLFCFFHVLCGLPLLNHVLGPINQAVLSGASRPGLLSARLVVVKMTG